jgi:hypothetical protein
MEAVKEAIDAGRTVFVTPELTRLAAMALPAIEQALRPVPPEMVAGWLADLGLAGLRNSPPDDNALQKSMCGLYEAVEGLPIICFTRETLRAFIQRFRFWPTPAELYNHLVEYRAVLRSRTMAAENIIRRMRELDAERAYDAEVRADRERLSSMLAGRVPAGAVIESVGAAMGPPCSAAPGAGACGVIRRRVRHGLSAAHHRHRPTRGATHSGSRARPTGAPPPFRQSRTRWQLWDTYMQHGTNLFGQVNRKRTGMPPSDAGVMVSEIVFLHERWSPECCTKRRAGKGRPG